MCRPFKKAAENRGRYVLSEPATTSDIITMAQCLIKQRFRKGKALANPKDALQYIQLQLASYEHEVFAVLLLDNRHRIISYEELFHGTIDGASVHPREVVKTALRHNAAAVILAHNHPSGVAEPSQSDQSITQRLKEALALVDIRVLDHFIIGDQECVSFAERGLI